MINIIAAVSENGVIGNHGKISWNIPEDLLHFNQKTQKSVLIMGRKTYKSIGRVLSGRYTIVISSQKNFMGENLNTATTLEAGLCFAKKLTDTNKFYEIFICGGQQLYEEGLKYADKLYITRIHANFEGDSFFPKINKNDYKLVNQKSMESANKIQITYLTYEKI